MSYFLKIREHFQAIKFKKRAKVIDNGGLKVRLQQYIKTGDKVSLGENCRLLCWDQYHSGNTIQSLNPNLVIGNNFRATRNLTIQCAGNIIIGDNVLVASDVFIINYNHGLDPITDNYLNNNLEVNEIKIEDGVWIGNSVIILPGVKIGKKSIIGAGSVVCKSIPDYCVAVGNPARIIKRYDHSSNIWRKE